MQEADKHLTLKIRSMVTVRVKLCIDNYWKVIDGPSLAKLFTRQINLLYFLITCGVHDTHTHSSDKCIKTVTGFASSLPPQNGAGSSAALVPQFMGFSVHTRSSVELLLSCVPSRQFEKIWTHFFGFQRLSALVIVSSITDIVVYRTYDFVSSI